MAERYWEPQQCCCLFVQACSNVYIACPRLGGHLGMQCIFSSKLHVPGLVDTRQSYLTNVFEGDHWVMSHLTLSSCISNSMNPLRLRSN